MFRLITGYPGSGKSTLVYNEINKILKAGKTGLLVVPEQMLVAGERDIALSVPDIYTLNIEVLSFRRLANRIFREYGGLCCNYPGGGADILIMQKALLSVLPALKLYNNTSPDDMRTVKMLIEARKTLIRNKISLKALSDICEKTEVRDSFFDKLDDFSLIFAEYERILLESFDDPDDELTRLADNGEYHKFFAGKYIFIDGFNDFTKQEYDIIKIMMKYGDEVTATINYPENDERPAFNKSKRCSDMLKRLVASYSNGEFESVRASYKSKTDALCHLSENLFAGNKNKYSGNTESIRLRACPGVVSEIEYLFEDIAQYVKNGGRYRDCTVSCFDVDAYSGIIEGTAKKYGIPVFASKRNTLTGRPAVRALRMLIKLSSDNYALEDMIEFIKSGFSPLDGDEMNLIENYCRTWKINGRKRWSFDWLMNPGGRRAKTSGNEKLKRINEARKKLADKLLPFTEEFGKAETCLEKLRSLTNVLLSLNMPQKFDEEAAKCRNEGDLSAADNHLATWKCIISCFDVLCAVQGDSKCNSRTFLSMLDTVIQNTDIGHIPTTGDEVHFGDISLIRAENPIRIYIIGMSDGAFPRDMNKSTFSDSECRRLSALGIEIVDDSEQRLYNDYFSVYAQMSVARDRLLVSYPVRSLSGNKNEPSRLFGDIMAIFDNLKIESPCGLTLGELKFKKNSAFQSGEFKEELSPFNIKRIYGDTMTLSQSRIESFAKCPFAYSYKYLIGINDEESSDFGSDVIGTVMHGIFEKFIKTAESKNSDITAMSESERDLLLENVIDEYYRQFCSEDEHNIRNERLFGRIKLTSKVLLKDLQKEYKESDFRPIGCEIPVGYETPESIKSPILVTDDQSRINFHGFIDRADFRKSENGDVYVKIVDYKTGDKSISDIDTEHGINIQMYLYIMALCDGGDKFDSITGREKGRRYIPCGAVYHILKRPDKIDKPAQRNRFLTEDAAEPDGKSKLHSRDDIYELIEKTKQSIISNAEGMKSGRCDISPLKTGSTDGCEYCSLKPICRKSSGTKERKEDI